MGFTFRREADWESGIQNLPAMVSSCGKRAYQSRSRELGFTIPALSSDRLRLMVMDFWKANRWKPTVSTNQFIYNTRLALTRAPAAPQLTIPHDLLEILVHDFSLQFEGAIDLMHRLPLFTQWCSLEDGDRVFGAHGPFIKQNLAGKNTFLILHSLLTEKEDIYKLVKEWIST